MLKIRAPQMEALSRAAASAFERAVAEHLRACFADACDALGDEGTTALVREGIARARAHGVVGERGVCKYACLMIAHGRSFDTDLAWAAAAFADPSAPPDVRLERVVERALAEAPDPAFEALEEA